MSFNNLKVFKLKYNKICLTFSLYKLFFFWSKLYKLKSTWCETVNLCKRNESVFFLASQEKRRLKDNNTEKNLGDKKLRLVLWLTLTID